jgi:hypothetical protein
MPLTAATAEPQAKKQKTRIARLLLPQLDANSALLPPDKWILKTAYEFVKDNKSFHNTIGRAAIYAGLGFGALIAGAVGAVMLFPLAVPMAAAGAAALGAAVFSGFRVKHHLGRFMTETLPGLRGEVGKKYLDYKMSELKAAWQRNLDERRKKKAEAKKDAPAQKAPEPAAPEAKKPEVKQEAPKPETAAQPAPAKPEAKKEEKKSLGSAFADFARKMAEERARKALEARAKEQKPADKQPDAPKPPAP